MRLKQARKFTKSEGWLLVEKADLHPEPDTKLVARHDLFRGDDDEWLMQAVASLPNDYESAVEMLIQLQTQLGR